jgi:hypothetical protein
VPRGAHSALVALRPGIIAFLFVQLLYSLRAWKRETESNSAEAAQGTFAGVTDTGFASGATGIDQPIVESSRGIMISSLAKLLRGLHLVIGITAPAPGHDERSFVFMWLGIIVFFIAFCAFLVYFIPYIYSNL